jgi:hypothetical protein
VMLVRSTVYVSVMYESKQCVCYGNIWQQALCMLQQYMAVSTLHVTAIYVSKCDSKRFTCYSNI